MRHRALLLREGEQPKKEKVRWRKVENERQLWDTKRGNMGGNSQRGSRAQDERVFLRRRWQ